jgi:hypothetical protein
LTAIWFVFAFSGFDGGRQGGSNGRRLATGNLGWLPNYGSTASGASRGHYQFHVQLSLSSISLSAHPLTYIWQAVDEPHALCRTFVQEPDRIHIDQRHFIQLQHDPWTARCQLLCDFLKIFRLNSPD